MIADKKRLDKQNALEQRYLKMTDKANNSNHSQRWLIVSLNIRVESLCDGSSVNEQALDASCPAIFTWLSFVVDNRLSIATV